MHWKKRLPDFVTLIYLECLGGLRYVDSVLEIIGLCISGLIRFDYESNPIDSFNK